MSTIFNQSVCHNRAEVCRVRPNLSNWAGRRVNNHSNTTRQCSNQSRSVRPEANAAKPNLGIYRCHLRRRLLNRIRNWHASHAMHTYPYSTFACHIAQMPDHSLSHTHTLMHANTAFSRQPVCQHVSWPVHCTRTPPGK